MKKITLAILSLLFLISCSHHKNKKMIQNDIQIGRDLKANSYSDIYFSSQPKEKDFEALKTQNFKTIINLRSPTEYDQKSEEYVVKKLGMTYINIPFSKDMSLNDKYISKVTKEVMSNREKGKILIHCSTGNRVGIWLGGHFYKDHGLTKDESLTIAKKLGLKKDKAIKKLELYLTKKESTATSKP